MKRFLFYLLTGSIVGLLTYCKPEAVSLPAGGTYRGASHEGCAQGYGEFTSADRRESYSGQWVNGMKEGYGRWQRGDSLYEGFFAADRMNGQGYLRYPDGNIHRGNWTDNRRDGYGELTDTTGCTYRGTWEADTLAYGSRTDTAGSYTGRFNAALLRQGFGVYTSPEGHYYSGEWADGLRQGWGFAVEPHQVVKCGTWRKGRFQGEQIVYNPERVYGIDISKYQHGNPRKPCGIRWKDLRITHLGAISKKRIQNDRADYPVSFVYVKASQGTRIKNRFYAQDILQARKHGYACGAYHFFSTQPGQEQARFFLRTAWPKKGDLPPMLDVELTDKQIKSLGGPEAMFREIMVWMKEVEAQVHTRPVLYVSQSFVNDYLPLAPRKLQEEYQVWVARYGAYKPYVHLLYWQLSPDGRVTGIQGHVDINVYNGTKEHFRDYVRQNAVR